MWFECPYLDANVELTDERTTHIVTKHTEVADEYVRLLNFTLAAPQLVMESRRSRTALIFSRWYHDLQGGKYFMAVVERDRAGRYWIITAHLSDVELRGEVIWRAN
jgi:hypothetical protein